MRNHQELCQRQYRDQQKEDPHRITRNRIRKGTDHFRIPLAKQTQPRHQLENRRILLEKGTKIFLQRQDLKTKKISKKTTTTQTRRNHSEKGEST